jgi:uncharacterized SAM-binding protein YcdF (DUF218 family)
MKEIEPNLKLILDFLIETTPIEQLPVSDGIFVFGHIDPRLAKHVAKLWNMKKAPKIILTGKGRRDLPEGFESESEYYASILKQNGVPDSAIILEKQSTNSLENVLIGIKIAKENSLNPKTLIVCTMPPLLRRAIATLNQQFPDISVFGSAFIFPFKEYLIEKRIKRILAEFDRFEAYAEKGDIVPIDVPSDVVKAVEEIRLVMK